MPAPDLPEGWTRILVNAAPLDAPEPIPFVMDVRFEFLGREGKQFYVRIGGSP